MNTFDINYKKKYLKYKAKYLKLLGGSGKAATTMAIETAATTMATEAATTTGTAATTGTATTGTATTGTAAATTGTAAATTATTTAAATTGTAAATTATTTAAAKTTGTTAATDNSIDLKTSSVNLFSPNENIDYNNLDSVRRFCISALNEKYDSTEEKEDIEDIKSYGEYYVQAYPNTDVKLFVENYRILTSKYIEKKKKHPTLECRMTKSNIPSFFYDILSVLESIFRDLANFSIILFNSDGYISIINTALKGGYDIRQVEITIKKLNGIYLDNNLLHNCLEVLNENTETVSGKEAQDIKNFYNELRDLPDTYTDIEKSKMDCIKMYLHFILCLKNIHFLLIIIKKLKLINVKYLFNLTNLFSNLYEHTKHRLANHEIIRPEETTGICIDMLMVDNIIIENNEFIEMLEEKKLRFLSFGNRLKVYYSQLKYFIDEFALKYGFIRNKILVKPISSQIMSLLTISPEDSEKAFLELMGSKSYKTRFRPKSKKSKTDSSAAEEEIAATTEEEIAATAEEEIAATTEEEIAATAEDEEEEDVPTAAAAPVIQQHIYKKILSVNSVRLNMKELKDSLKNTIENYELTQNECTNLRKDIDGNPMLITFRINTKDSGIYIGFYRNDQELGHLSLHLRKEVNERVTRYHYKDMISEPPKIYNLYKYYGKYELTSDPVNPVVPINPNISVKARKELIKNRLDQLCIRNIITKWMNSKLYLFFPPIEI